MTVLATEGLSIRVEQARDLVAARGAPAVGRPWRVIIVEDADRLTERAADALLKALEEPVARTVWILCAPSLEDVIITIRSRSRHVRLRTPPPEAVAELLVRRDGIDPAMALYAARAAQSHVGLARRLARDEGARIRRRDVIALAGQIRGVGDAVDAAADLAAIADRGVVGVLDRARRRRAGAAAGDARRRPVGPHPAAARPLAARRPGEGAEDAGHPVRPRRRRPRRSSTCSRSTATRSCCTPAPRSPWSTRTCRPRPARWPTCSGPSSCCGRWTPIGTARERIDANVPPLLALEAMAISLQLPR